MDIYEALKSGGNADTIMASFEKELQAAVKRIEAEKAAAEQEKTKKRQLASARTALAEALKEYYTTLLGSESEIVKAMQTSDMEKQLEELEKDLKETVAALEQLATLFDKEPTKTPTEKKKETDDEVLANFLRTLI